MHELGYTKDIVSRVTEAAQASGAHSVKTVFLTIGEMRDIVDDLLKQCFHWMARDTIAADASIVIDRAPSRCAATSAAACFASTPGEASPAPARAAAPPTTLSLPAWSSPSTTSRLCKAIG